MIKRNPFLAHILRMSAIIAICTMISYVLYYYQLRVENIMIVYLTGVLLVIIKNKKFTWGVIASLLSIALFNFFFTQPRFSFAMDDPNYFITISIFFIVSFFVSTLTSKLQNALALSLQKEQQTKVLYENSKAFLQISGLENIIYYGIQSIADILHYDCVIYLHDDEQEDSILQPPYFKETMNYQTEIEAMDPPIWCYQNVRECGNGTDFFSDRHWRYVPLSSPQNVLGVVGIYIDHDEKDDRLVLDTLLSQIALAIKKEQLSMIQEKNMIEIEKEKLRNTLLRSISHDLRTPLTGISGSSAFILESYDRLSKKEVLDLIRNIGSDATWLNNMVENLLNMSRLQDDHLQLRLQDEVVDDLLEEVISRLPKSYRSNIHIHLPKLLLIKADERLFIQVLVNIIDNAFKHTLENSEVFLRVYPEGDFLLFEIADNGGGIKDDMMDKLFDSFVSEEKGISSDAYRGTGLGLNIAKEIIHAHHGHIKAYNNDIGGATFLISMPWKEHNK